MSSIIGDAQETESASALWAGVENRLRGPCQDGLDNFRGIVNPCRQADTKPYLDKVDEVACRGLFLGRHAGSACIIAIVSVQTGQLKRLTTRRALISSRVGEFSPPREGSEIPPETTALFFYRQSSRQQSHLQTSIWEGTSATSPTEAELSACIN